MIYDKISKQFINMNPNQIGSETDRFVILNEEQIQRANEMISAGHFNEDYVLEGTITPPTLEYLKGIATETVKNNFYLLIKDGCAYNGFVFNYDENTMNNILLQKNRYEFEGGDIFKISDRTKTKRQFTKNQLWAFGAEFSGYLAPRKEWYSDIMNEIEKAETIEALNLINLEYPTEEE